MVIKVNEVTNKNVHDTVKPLSPASHRVQVSNDDSNVYRAYKHGQRNENSKIEPREVSSNEQDMSVVVECHTYRAWGCWVVLHTLDRRRNGRKMERVGEDGEVGRRMGGGWRGWEEDGEGRRGR